MALTHGREKGILMDVLTACNRSGAEVEGNLVKALNHCRLENMKKLIEPYFFWELSNIEDIFFTISLGWILGLW